MKLKKHVCVLWLVTVFLVSCFALQLNVDSFLPPVKGGPTQPETTVKETGEDEVAAENLQDGLIYANNLIWEQGDGFRSVVFGSGTGYIAGAVAEYTVYPNINATLTGKRAAYLEAYYKAKAYMLQGLMGYLTRKNETFREALVSVDTPEKNIGAQLMTQTETIEQVANGLLRGFITYEVRDAAKEDQGRVYVSIAISPATIESVNRITNGLYFARTAKEGIDAVLVEIQAGIIPPVGGKVVILPETGETIVVGFGSAIVRSSQNAKLATEYRKAALEASKIRATQALVDIVSGSQTIWRTGLYEGTASGSVNEDYSGINEKVADLPYEDNELKKAITSASSDEFVNLFIKTSEYKSFSSGVVPPGVIVQTAVDKTVETEGYGWAFAIAVYYPPLTLNINSIYSRMQSMEPGEGGIVVIGPQTPSENPQGPTGQVSDNSGL